MNKALKLSVRNSMRLSIVVLAWCVFFSLAGCSRTHYRSKANQQTYAVIGEQSADTRPWAVPETFTIDPNLNSRLHDPSDPDDPSLPDPGPHLYSYKIPEVETEEVGKSAGVEHRETAVIAGREERPSTIGALTIQPIPESYWNAVPRQCLSRMLEFESVDEEWFDQYGEMPGEGFRDTARRLGLRGILELSRLNSREYQAQKEQLYRAALAVTSARFEYAPKFSTGGNGVDADVTQDRNNGETVNSAGIGSSLEGGKMLSTGGTILGRIANNVVLTFDGPEGFATDVSSELFFSINQALFQRDILLNPLIQTERNLIYAARDYARFRREFFTGLAAQYYGLLRTYRSIEIESQNYFSLVRTFEQAKAEVRASVKGAPNPVAVDQFEQGMLSGRSTLISTCNALEDGLDRLKLVMGLPTETPINIELVELKELTLLDQIEVAAERMRRWRQRVRDQQQQSRPDRGGMLNADIYLVERLLEWLDLRSAIEAPSPGYSRFEKLLARFRVDRARGAADRNLAGLRNALEDTALSPVILVYQRTADLLEAQLGLARLQIELAEKEGDSAEAQAKGRELDEVKAQLESSVLGLTEVLQDPEQLKLRELLAQAEQLRQRTDKIVNELDRLLGTETPADPESQLARTRAETEQLMLETETLLREGRTGLLANEIGMDDAMATALIQRLDLMNERGRLADDWRTIKLRADDLKSVLNLNVTERIGTSGNRPFNFSLDNSQTRLALTFDLPLNRLNQRNDFRRALIDYQAGRRSLMSLEDTIKFNVRNSLRSLAETRLQYPISVTRAALAAEQVTSIRLQLALGVPGVRGTDLLDALQSSRGALIAVANSRIGYIVDDARFVLELELMRLDAAGNWPGLNDPEFEPLPSLVYPKGAGPTYGEIPSFLKVSEQIKRMLTAPLPGEEAEAGQFE